MTHLYFKVAPASPVMAHLKAWKRAANKRNKALNALRIKLVIPKQNEWWGSESYITGLGAPTVDLPGWRWDRKQGVNVPALLTPEGKALRKALDAIPAPKDWRQVSEDVFKHGFIIARGGKTGTVSCWASFGWTTRGVIVAMRSEVKKAAKVWPKGLKEITGSECARIEGKPEAAE